MICYNKRNTITMHNYYTDPQPNTPASTLAVADIVRLAHLADEAFFIPSPELFDSYRLVTGRLATDYTPNKNNGNGAFLDADNKVVPDDAAESVFKASQYNTWELTDDLRLKYTEALSEVRGYTDMHSQPEVIRNLYRQVALGATATANITDTVQSFRGILEKSLALDAHVRSKKKQYAQERLWRQQGANIAHNRLILEAAGQFNRIEQDENGNLVCYVDATQPNGSIKEVKLSYEEAEFRAKYKRELQELDRITMLDNRSAQIEQDYTEVLEYNNYLVWVNGGHDPDLEVWVTVPEEFRLGNLRGGDFDKVFTYIDRSGEAQETTLRRGDLTKESSAFQPKDAMTIGAHLTELTGMPTILRTVASLVRYPRDRLRDSKGSSSLADSDARKNEIAQRVEIIRAYYETSPTKSKPNSYNLDDLEKEFAVLRDLDIQAWVDEKKRWYIRYAPQEQTAREQRQEARRIISAEMAGINPFEEYMEGKISPYSRPASLLKSRLAALSENYQAYLQSKYMLGEDVEPKQFGRLRPSFINSLAPIETVLGRALHKRTTDKRG